MDVDWVSFRFVFLIRSSYPKSTESIEKIHSLIANICVCIMVHEVSGFARFHKVNVEVQRLVHILLEGDQRMRVCICHSWIFVVEYR